MKKKKEVMKKKREVMKEEMNKEMKFMQEMKVMQEMKDMQEKKVELVQVMKAMGEAVEPGASSVPLLLKVNSHS